MLSCASQLAELHLVNFHASCKPWPGLSGWLMKSGYIESIRRLKAKKSVRKEHNKFPVFQRLMGFETCFFPIKLSEFLHCVTKHYSHWDCFTQLIRWKKSSPWPRYHFYCNWEPVPPIYFRALITRLEIDFSCFDNILILKSNSHDGGKKRHKFWNGFQLKNKFGDVTTFWVRKRKLFEGDLSCIY